MRIKKVRKLEHMIRDLKKYNAVFLYNDKFSYYDISRNTMQSLFIATSFFKNNKGSNMINKKKLIIIILC